MKIDLFRFTGVKKTRTPKVKTYKEYGRVCNCVSSLDENGDFIAIIDSEDGTKLQIPFTPNSYELKNKTHIFHKSTCKQSKQTCVIRTPWNAKVNPGSSEIYTPIAVGWIYSGKLTEYGDKIFFNVHNIVSKA